MEDNMGSHRWFASFFCVLAVAIWTVQSRSNTTLAAVDPSWPQWGQNQQHTGTLNIVGQSLNRILANIVYDPLVADEEAANGGDLLAHYETPLVDGNDVYMESKSGSYNVNTYTTERWHQNKFTWQAGNLVRVWTFDSDWVPPGCGQWVPLRSGSRRHDLQTETVRRQRGVAYQPLRRHRRQHLYRVAAD